MESGVRTVRLRTGVTVQCFVRGRVGKMNDDGGAPLLRIYEDTGHLVLWECPRRVAADVRDFVGLKVTPNAGAPGR